MIATSDAYRVASRRHRTEYVRDSFDVIVTLGDVDIAVPQSITSESYDEGAESTLFTRETLGLMRTYMSGARALADGRFAVQPFIDVTFSSAKAIPAITLEFARDIGPAPSGFVVYGYQGGTLAYTITKSDNASYFVVINQNMQNITRVRVVFTAGTPGERIELYGLTFGDGFIFDGDDIVDFVHNRAGHPRSLEMYMSDMLVSVDNSHGRFPLAADAELAGWFDKDRTARLYYRYPLDGGTHEQFLAATMYLNDATEDGSVLNVDCSDIFDQMSKTEYIWGYMNDPRYGTPLGNSVYSAVKSVLDDFGGLTYDISGVGLEDIPVIWPVPVSSHLEALQQFAIFACGVFRVDANGVISFVRHAKEITDYYINTFAYPQAPFSRPESIRTAGKPEYATFEEDWFRADGKQILLPENSAECVDTGYALNLLPNAGTGQYPGHEINIDIVSAKYFSRARVCASNGNSAIDTYNLYASSGAAPLIPSALATVDRGRDAAWHLDFSGVVWIFFNAKSAAKQQRVRITEVNIDDVSAADISSDDCVEPAKKESAAKCRQIDLTYRTWVPRSDGGVIDPDFRRTKRVTLPYKVKVRIMHDGMTHQQMAFSNFTPAVYNTGEHVGGSWATGFEITDGASATGPYTADATWAEYDLPAEQQATHLIYAEGEVLDINNPLVESATDVNRITDWLSSYYSSEFEYSFTYLGFPEIDAGDLISYDGRVVEVISHKITGRAGSFRGELVVRGGA